MYKYFKSIAEKTCCSQNGVCSIHPSTSALYDILILEIREAAFYLVKIKELGFLDKSAQNACLEALSLFLINTSLNEKKYLKIINNLNKIKKRLREQYVKYCKDSELPCEVLKTNFEISEKTTITELIKYAQINSVNKLKIIDKTKQSLFELITLYAKLSAVIVLKIKRFDNNYNEFDYEILRFFALTNAYSIRIEKIERRIKEFCPIALKIKEKYFSQLAERYGKKQSTVISTDEAEGHSILISGDDLIELEEVLRALQKMNLGDKINIYTNGSLLLAHFYPYFKNNKYLKGHWGINDAQYDFSMFKGSILITRNFLQKIDSLYKGEIYSNKVISFSRVIDIENNNYEPLIKSALSIKGFETNNHKTPLNINYDTDEINKTVKNIIDKKTDEVVIVAGNIESKKIFEEYKHKKIINFSTPLESDILLDSVRKLIRENIKITMFFPDCDIESIYNVFLFLNKNIKLYISDCSHIIINPHVIEALKNNFDVEVIY